MDAEQCRIKVIVEAMALVVRKSREWIDWAEWHEDKRTADINLIEGPGIPYEATHVKGGKRRLSRSRSPERNTRRWIRVDRVQEPEEPDDQSSSEINIDLRSVVPQRSAVTRPVPDAREGDLVVITPRSQARNESSRLQGNRGSRADQTARSSANDAQFVPHANQSWEARPWCDHCYKWGHWTQSCRKRSWSEHQGDSSRNHPWQGGKGQGWSRSSSRRGW